MQRPTRFEGKIWTSSKVNVGTTTSCSVEIMVPSIRIHRPSTEAVDTFDSRDLDGVRMRDSGVRPQDDDEVTDDFGMNRIENGHRPRKMSPREERLKWWRIYAMHFLFSWNSRTFEYVSVRQNAFMNSALADLADIPRCPCVSKGLVCNVFEVSSGPKRKGMY